MDFVDIPIQRRTPDLDLAIEAAIEAERVISEIYGKGFDVRVKDDGTLVTRADTASNVAIMDVLSKSKHPVLSEESQDNESRLDEEYLWIVDPLDGTADFVDRTGEFTVMIALVRDGKPVLGVISWPPGNELYIAQKGEGAFRRSLRGWERISVSRTAQMSSARVVCSRHHLSERETELAGKLGVGKFLSVGSSLKACRISSGEADLYFTYTDRMSEWDTAASNCLVTEAGGRMTDMNGSKMTYNRRDVRHRDGILVTNGALHDMVIASL